MLHLKMYWLKGTPIESSALPEGYSITKYKNGDMNAWLECCKNGLIPDDADKAVFDERITNHENIDVENDVFFLDYNGEHIGTASAIYHPESNCGELHMVGIKTEFRGKGLSKFLNEAAIKKLDAQGVDYIYLKTHEWRKGAVKSYLSAGFKPVEYDEGMQKRWEAVITEFDIDSVDMVKEDASFYKTIYKAAEV